MTTVPKLAVQRAPRWAWALLGGSASVGVLVVVLAAFGGRPHVGPPGIEDAGPLTGWGLPLARLLGDAAGTAVVGCLLCAAALIPTERGQLRPAGMRACRTAASIALLWALAALAQIVLTGSDFWALPLPAALDPRQLVVFVGSTSQGRALLAQLLLAGLVSGTARWLLTARSALLVLALALVGVAVPAVTGHSGSADNHMLAVSSLLVHLLGTALWVGGLGALLAFGARRSAALPTAAARFSSVAGWCFAAVAVSGAVNAAVRLGRVGALWDTGYGVLVLAKAAALVVLGGLGWAHRRYTLPNLSGTRARNAFLRLAAVEVAVMAATFGLAVGLSRTPSPVPEDLDLGDASPARALLGYPLPPPPTPARLLLDGYPDGFAITAVVLAAALYLTGVRVLHHRGDSWPGGRTAAWIGGLVVILIATSSGLGRYAPVLFSAHMVQHMTVNMLAPILLVLGAPLTLALRALPSTRDGTGARAGLLRVVHSRPARVLTLAPVAAAIFVAGLYALYFTPLFGALMRSHWGHVGMQAHFVLSGYLFFWVLIGVDPGPRRPPYLARLVLMLLVIALHAFFSVALLSSTTVIAADWFAALQRPWRPDLLADQRLGGGIAWALGELPVVAVLAVLVVQWVREDARTAQRADRSGEAELAAYNARLAQLAARDRRASR